MQAIRSILVVLEPEHSESLALKRAKLIAGTTGARLHLLVCDKKHEHSALLSLLQVRPDRRTATASPPNRRGIPACMKPSSRCSWPKAVAW